MSSKKCHGFLSALALSGLVAAGAVLVRKYDLCAKLAVKCCKDECCSCKGYAGNSTGTNCDAELGETYAAEAPDISPGSSPAAAPEPAPTPEPAPAANDTRYGDGSFTGSNPPEGFDIKGNERSMKYHLPGSLSYDRTNADVWFNSPEAAERAGFTRSQR